MVIELSPVSRTGKSDSEKQGHGGEVMGRRSVPLSCERINTRTCCGVGSTNLPK